MSNAVKTCKLDWTKDDLILLIAEYPYKGPNISKLREKFNRRQIWYKAYTLGVHKKKVDYERMKMVISGVSSPRRT